MRLPSVVTAVGVGLAGMLFALADPVLRKLPYADPDHLVSIGFGMPAPGTRPNQADVPTLASWQARTDLFQGVAAFQSQGWTGVRLSDRIVSLQVVEVTDNLLEVLGVATRFDQSDRAAAWVSRRVATTLSGGELQPGRSAAMVPDGLLRVSQVLPDSFLLPEVDRTEAVDALTVLRAGPVITIERGGWSELNVVARLRQGVTLEVVAAALNASMAAIHRRVAVRPLPTLLNARLRGLATGAMFAGNLLVFVCWTNVFGMAVTRTLYRAAEIGTRTALGAPPFRIAALLAKDGLKIAAIGSASALAVTSFALATALPALPPKFATVGVPAVTMRVVLFVALAGFSVGVAWCFGSLLAWRLGLTRQALHVVSRDGRAMRAVRFVVIAAQLGAASVLLVGSALLGHSFLNLMRVDTGLDEQVQTLTVAHDPNIPVALRRDVIDRTLTALRGETGVVATAAISSRILDGRPKLSTAVIIDGRVSIPDWTWFAGDYFTVMSFQFLKGGPPESADTNAVVITEGASQEFFRGLDPIGRLLPPRGVRVVGVVRDVRTRGLSVAPKPGVFLHAGGWTGSQPETTYLLRIAKNSGQVGSVEHVIRSVDPLVTVLDGGSIRALLNRSIRDRIFATLVIGLFSIASVLVSAVGLAGVVSYTVAKRTREIAIRLTLGATIAAVIKLVVREAVIAGVAGIAVGVIASVWLSRALESMVYGIHAADPLTLALTAAGLLVGVLLAATVPGMRAGRIAPARALRIE